MRRTRNFALATVVLGTVFSGLACGSSDGQAPQANNDLGIDEMGLGTAVPTCSTAGSTGYTLTSPTKTLALTLLSGVPAIVSVVNGVVKVNGWSCVDSAGVKLTTTTVQKITVTGSGGNDKLIVDQLTGSFGSIFSSTGGMTVTFSGSGNSFMLRQTASADKCTMGKSGAGDVFVEATGDTNADIRVIGGNNFYVSQGAGADTYVGTGGSITAAHLATGVTTLSSLTTGVTVYGGDGNDTMTGGGGTDSLWGGANDDTFKSPSSDGADNYYGEGGTDTLDYTGRTAALTVDIAPYAGTTGTVDLSTVTGAGVGTKTLDLKLDGGGTLTTTFASEATVALIVAKINTAMSANVARVDMNGKLILESTTRTSSSSIQVLGSGNAQGTLGLTAATYKVNAADADDGESGENDDVSYSVENITGGTGADKFWGSDVSNTINGADGNDTIFGGIANTSCASDVDVLNGGNGNDKFDMSAVADCKDTVSGGAGIDTVDYQLRTAVLTIDLDNNADDGDGGATETDNVKDDNEIILGGSGADTITGSANDDELHGGPGGDTISGGAGNDTIVGDTGDDTLNGNADEDIFTETGNDSKYTATIACGAGVDIINGGAGTDHVDYSTRSAVITCQLCVDAAATGAGGCTANACGDLTAGEDGTGTHGDTLANVESLASGTAADALTCGADACYLYGNAQNDTLTGGAGDDYIEGNAGTNTINGAGGVDTCDQGAGGTSTNCEM